MLYFRYFLIAVLVLVSSVGEANPPLNPNVEEPLYTSKDFITIGSAFTSGIEGPAVDLNGNLFAVNIEKSGTIAIVDIAGNAKIFATLPAGSVGNGIRFDKPGNMYIADYKAHNILVIPVGKTVAEVYAHNASFNQPNDLAIMSSGILFASDPNWSNNTGKLWRIGTDKVPVLLDGTMGTTNGIEVSQDEKRLYVGESAQRKIWRYDLNEKGEISNKTVFVSFTDFDLDGMRSDVDGNLYVSRYGKGTVAIFSPDGTLLHEVTLKGKSVSNIAFGGSDGRTCFLTMQDRKMIETFRTETPGREWMVSHVRTIPIFAKTTKETITIDGLLTECSWANANDVTFANVNIGNSKSNSDNSMKVRTLWDQDNFYVGYEVTDQKIENPSTKNIWEQDSGGLYIDPGNEKAATIDDSDGTKDFDYEFIINAVDAIGYFHASLISETLIQHKTILTPTGYTIELAIPWSQIKTTPFPYKVMGILFDNNDRDNGVATTYDWKNLIATGVYARPNLWGDISLTKLLTCDQSTGIGVSHEIEDVIVFPNPFNTSSTIKISSGITLENAVMKVYDLCGREVRTVSINNSETKIEKGNIQSGIYIYNVINDKKIIKNGKFVVK